MVLVIVLIVSHVLFIVGCYLLASGINVVVKGRARARNSDEPALLGPIHDPGWIMHDFLTMGLASLKTGIVLTRDAHQCRAPHSYLAKPIARSVWQYM